MNREVLGTSGSSLHRNAMDSLWPWRSILFEVLLKSNRPINWLSEGSRARPPHFCDPRRRQCGFVRGFARVRMWQTCETTIGRMTHDPVGPRPKSQARLVLQLRQVTGGRVWSEFGVLNPEYLLINTPQLIKHNVRSPKFGLYLF